MHPPVNFGRQTAVTMLSNDRHLKSNIQRQDLPCLNVFQTRRSFSESISVPEHEIVTDESLVLSIESNSLPSGYLT